MTRRQAVSGDEISLELRHLDRHCLMEQPLRIEAEIDQR